MERGGPGNRTRFDLSSRFVFFFSSLFFSLSRSLVVVEFEEIERVWRVRKSLCFFRKHFARVVCVHTAEEEEKEEKAIDQNYPIACWEIQRLSLRLRFIFKNKH